MIAFMLWTYTASNHFTQSYFYNDDTFNFNYAQAKAAVGNYKEAEEVRLKFFWSVNNMKIDEPEKYTCGRRRLLEKTHF